MKVVLRMLVSSVLICGLILAANWFSVASLARSAWAEDARNASVRIWAYHPYFVRPNGLVLDVHEVGAGGARIDVTRMIFQAAAAFRDRSFADITLAFRGSARFILPGDEFQAIGRLYAAGENPVFLIRTLPERLRNPDGTRAFSEWTGGVIGVMNRQMEDHNTMHDRWYLNELLRK